MAHVLQKSGPTVSMNVPFERPLHNRMVRAAKSERQSLRQLILRFVQDGVERWESGHKAEAAR